MKEWQKDPSCNAHQPMNAAYFACWTRVFHMSRNHSLPKPHSPTGALTVWPPRLCSHRTPGSSPGSKERPRPQGTQLPHHSLQALQDSAQVGAQTLLFKCKCTHQKKVLSWRLVIWFNSLFSSSSWLKGMETQTRDNPHVHNDRHCKKELCFIPLKAFECWLKSLSWSWTAAGIVSSGSETPVLPDLISSDYCVYWGRAWSSALCGSTQLRRKWLQLILLSFVRCLSHCSHSSEMTFQGEEAHQEWLLQQNLSCSHSSDITWDRRCFQAPPHCCLSNCVCPVQTHICAINSWLILALQSNCKSGGTTWRWLDCLNSQFLYLPMLHYCVFSPQCPFISH